VKIFVIKQMATQKSLKINSINTDSLKNPLEYCDICGSEDIVETTEGFCCRTCGIVLEVQKLEYYKPYEDIAIQNAVLSKTRIGFKNERSINRNSVHMEKLSMLDSIRDGETNVCIAAKVEIRRIITGLGLSTKNVDIILQKFKEVRKKLGKGTKYRNPEKLAPCVIYFYYKQNNFPIREHDLLKLSYITKKDFNAFKLQMLEMWPQYQERNRQEYILQRILEVTEHFKLGMSFYYQSKKILYRFYENIKNTKDDVIVGLTVSIALLCSQNEDVKINAICNRLGIKMSTIQSQINRRIFERFKVSGFKSLVRSADLLKNVMVKLRIIDPKSIDDEKSELINDSEPESDIVHVTLGSAIQVFNSTIPLENFLFVKDNNRNLISVQIKTYHNTENNKNEFKKQDNVVLLPRACKSVNLKLWKLYYPTGPPVMET
jgi:hypothetical protein